MRKALGNEGVFSKRLAVVKRHRVAQVLVRAQQRDDGLRHAFAVLESHPAGQRVA
ncbi:MAG: hypothetical protein ABIR56_15090 [Polaromonas sp.]